MALVGRGCWCIFGSVDDEEVAGGTGWPALRVAEAVEEAVRFRVFGDVRVGCGP